MQHSIVKEVIQDALDSNSGIIIKGDQESKGYINSVITEIKRLMIEPIEFGSVTYDKSRVFGNNIYFIYIEEYCIKKIDLISNRGTRTLCIKDAKGYADFRVKSKVS